MAKKHKGKGKGKALKTVKPEAQALAVLQRESSEPTDPRERRVYYSGRTAAGVYVTPDRALMSSTFWAARRYLTQTVGQLPARVKQNTVQGEILVPNTRADQLLNWVPNREWTPFQLRETLTGWAITHGNGIAEIEFNNVGLPLALWPIHPDRTEFKRSLITGELIYEINNGVNGKVELGIEDVFHLRGFGDGPVGCSVVEYAAQNIGWQRAAELFGASFFGEGLHFGGAIIMKSKGDEESRDAVRDELNNMYRGPAKSGRWFIGDDSMQITKMTQSPNESQFIETLMFLVEEQCRWTGVPPHKVFHLLRMTFNNVEHMSQEVIGDAIVPWAYRWEQEVTRKLMGQNRQRQFCKFEIKALLRGSFKDRQEGLQIQRRNGIINADNWADTEDMPRPGSDAGGDKYIIEKNMVPMDRLDDIVDADMKKSLTQSIAPGADPAQAAGILAETQALLNLVSAEH